MNKDVIIGALVGLVIALLLRKYNGETPIWLWIIFIIACIPVIILWIYNINEKGKDKKKSD